MYKCIKCEATVEELPKGIIRCPNCAGKILSKLRPAVTREIKAR